MPAFDFRCAKCSTVFEATRASGSKANPACPKCKSKSTEKLLTPPAIQFKGSGFYKTDSAKKPVSEKPATDKPVEADTKSKNADAKTSKPETKN